MRRRLLWFSASLLLPLSACSSDSATTGAADTATADTGTPDSAAPDAAGLDGADLAGPDDTATSDEDATSGEDTVQGDDVPTGDEDTGPVATPYPLDDTLRVNQLQCVGTHNSYHVAPPEDIVPDWAYTHPPLEEQLRVYGARNFEIDSYPDAKTLEFPVVHLPGLDMGTTCASLAECFGEIAGWSDKNPGHHPLFIMLELKSTVGATQWIDALDQVVLEAFGADRVVTPDEVRGEAATLREAVTTTGWPTLGATRGRVFVIVMDDEDFYAAWSDGHPAGAGRAVFVHRPQESPDAAFIKMDNPGDGTAIQAAVKAGFIVRTRSDSITDEPGPDGLRDREAAFASGAQMISTDFLKPRGDDPYAVAIPGGTPSRCDPVNAPPECTSDAIESPERLPLTPAK